MRIIDAIVTNARRSRDHGRVEARVALTCQLHPGAWPETRILLTSAPAHDRRGRALRTRLIADAVRLAMATVPAPVAQAA